MAAGVIAALIQDLLFPISCVGCGAERTWLCSGCAPRVECVPYRICPSCRKVSTGGRVCERCRASSPLAGLVAAAPYRDPLVRGLIHGLKYDRARSAAEAIRLILTRGDALSRIPPPDIIVPIPLHRRRIHQRGFNQAEIIAGMVGEVFNIKVAANIIVRSRNTMPQAKRSDEERRNNVSGAFSARSPETVRGRRVLLVDDVFTTGSTMREAARALKDAGASEIWGAAVAYG